MNILFWNVQRVGVSSERAGAIHRIVQRYIKEHYIQVVVLCEVTSDFTFIHDFSSTRSHALAMEKQAVRTRRTIKKTSAQLGYSAYYIGADGALSSIIPLTVESIEVENYTELFEASPFFKGGSIFTKQSKRNVGRVVFDGHPSFNLFAYHANASTKASYLTPWVLQSLAENTDNFILVGDFNTSPMSLAGELPEGVRTIDGGPSHPALAPTSIYDYAFTRGYRGNVTVLDYVYTRVWGEYVSDHLPILVQLS